MCTCNFRKFILLTGLFGMLVLYGRAQPLPLDTAVRTGKLANGFTYYIRHNTEPNDRVVFYLVNKIGSMQEEDNQRGLAHFMEHMNFNGTKNFPKDELVQYLQKTGVRFGADLNAFTSFTETVYQLPLPSDDPSVVQNGLQIMRDWAAEATLDPVEIDKERGVVLEEKRMHNGAEQRMQDKGFAIQVNNSRYAKRVPIGTEEVLKNFTPATIHKFFTDWYRPDLQALVIVGDIDVNAIEQQVKKMFGDLKGPANKKVRQTFNIPLTGKNQFVSLTDPEQTETVISILIKQPSSPLRTKAEYRQSVINSLFNNAMASRLGELSQRSDPSFVQARGYMTEFMGGLDALSIDIVPKAGRLKEAFNSVWTEVIRMKQYGLTAEELERAKTNYLSNIENAYNERDKVPSASYVNEYMEYFLKGTAAPGIAKGYELAQEFSKDISLQEMNAYAKKVIKNTDRDIIIMAPAKEKTSLPAEATLTSWVNRVMNTKLAKWEEKMNIKGLLPATPTPGQVVSSEQIDSIGIRKLVLSNGLKVWLKPTNFKNDEIYFSAVSPGGSSIYPDSLYLDASSAGSMIPGLGAGEFTPVDLEKLLNGKVLQVQPYVGEMSEGINGFSTPKDLETALQLTWLYFTAPRKDTTLFANMINQSKSMLANRNDNPNAVLQDTLSLILSGNHYRRQPPSVQKMDSISLDRSFEIYKERFANAADFTFLFTGSIDTAVAIPLIEKYLGSLPSSGQGEQGRDLGIGVPKGQISKTIKKGKDDKAIVTLAYSGSYAYNEANNIQLTALGTLLQYRMIERVRELEGGAYSPSAGVTFDKIPRPKYLFFVRFICAPANVDKLVTAVNEELDKIKNGNVTDADITKFTAETNRSSQVDLRNNQYWDYYLKNAIKNGDSPMEILHEPALLKTITSKSVQETAKTYLDMNNYIKVVLTPEQ